MEKRVGPAGTLGEIVDFIHQIFAEWKVSEAGADIWFRGADHSSHQLLPKVYRPQYERLDEDDLF